MCINNTAINAFTQVTAKKEPQTNSESEYFANFVPQTQLEQDAIKVAQDIIKIDTSNYGDGSGPGERVAGEYVCQFYDQLGLEYTYLESEKNRASVITTLPGTDSSQKPLIVHGHLDVVPANARDWQVDPFAGCIQDGYLWGRGAVDMKNMDGMVLASIKYLVNSGFKPKRTLIFAMVADEEHGGRKGAHWLVDKHANYFANASEAISEVGGYSVNVRGQRVYILQTAEKGIAWIKIIANGRAGHGSQVNTDNAVAHLCQAMARIGAYQWPVRLVPTVEQLLRGVAELVGKPFAADNPDAIAEIIAELGYASNFVGATLRTGANLTQIDAGYKCNVIPSTATGVVDIRYLPGEQENVLSKVQELAGSHVQVEPINLDVALEVPFAGSLVDKMCDSLISQDPQAKVLPYMLSAGTDAKAFSKLGIKGYGYAPLQLPSDFNFTAMFHGVDERVPIASIAFGARTLTNFLQTL